MSLQGEIAVTGASGFVGRRLVARLAAEGRAVRAVISGRREVPPFPAGVSVYSWDAASADPPTFLEGAAAVCHAAAFLPPSYTSSAFARQCLEINALATITLAEAAVRAGVRRFLHFSSANAYRAQYRPVREDDALYPSARAPYYLASKVCGEIFASHFDETGQLDVTVLRPSAIYGPTMPETGLVPTFTRRLRAAEPIDVADGGRPIVDLVHVDDVAAAACAALETGKTGHYNIGSGTLTTVLNVAETLASILGADPALIRVAPPNPGPPGGFSLLDLKRSRELLGYTPRDLRAGLEDYARSVGALP